MKPSLGLLPGLALCLTLGLTLSLGPGAPAPASAATVSTTPGVPARLLVQRLLEDRVLALTNQQRRKHGCVALRGSAALRKAARGHTVSMALANSMSHQLPGEARFSSRISKAGYRGWRLVAENIARGFSTPNDVVAAWMRSPSHRRNILNCRLRDLGVGVVLKDGQLWWTQDFGTR